MVPLSAGQRARLIEDVIDTALVLEIPTDHDLAVRQLAELIATTVLVTPSSPITSGGPPAPPARSIPVVCQPSSKFSRNDLPQALGDHGADRLRIPLSARRPTGRARDPEASARAAPGALRLGEQHEELFTDTDSGRPAGRLGDRELGGRRAQVTNPATRERIGTLSPLVI